jgi:hypothetical protein
VEGGWLFNGLKKRSFMSIPSPDPDPAKYPLCVYFLLGYGPSEIVCRHAMICGCFPK